MILYDQLRRDRPWVNPRIRRMQRPWVSQEWVEDVTLPASAYAAAVVLQRCGLRMTWVYPEGSWQMGWKGKGLVVRVSERSMEIAEAATFDRWANSRNLALSFLPANIPAVLYAARRLIKEKNRREAGYYLRHFETTSLDAVGVKR